jgi:hypothetical protein
MRQKKLCYAVVEETFSVVVDEWIYDFGRNRFVHYVVFEHGRLVSVSSAATARRPPPIARNAPAEARSVLAGELRPGRLRAILKSLPC